MFGFISHNELLLWTIARCAEKHSADEEVVVVLRVQYSNSRSHRNLDSDSDSDSDSDGMSKCFALLPMAY